MTSEVVMAENPRYSSFTPKWARDKNVDNEPELYYHGYIPDDGISLKKKMIILVILVLLICGLLGLLWCVILPQPLLGG